MKIELEILQDQLDLLESIKKLPVILEETIGKLPQSWPDDGGELQEIKTLCENLEFKWKKWVLNYLSTGSTELNKLMSGIRIAKNNCYSCGDD